ncbi:MAG: hypothetical protein Q9191_004727 [Dirinaria sp. TL-2023a]
MASRSHDLEQQGHTKEDGTKAHPAALKKRRSLSRLFTSRSRKSSVSQSQPSSPATPVTPKIPDRFLPTNPDVTQVSLAQSSSEENGNTDIRSHRQSDGPGSIRSERTSRQDSLSDPQAHTRSDPAVNASSTVQSPPCAPFEFKSGPDGNTKDHASSGGAPEAQARGLSSSLRKSVIQLSRNRLLLRPATAAAVLSSANSHEPFHNSRDDVGGSSTIHHARKPGQEPHDAVEMRASVRSAITNTSTLAHASSTESSSVMTRHTSVSDLTVEIYEKGHQRDIGMTVDEAIGMYAAGFGDEIDSERTSITNTSAADEERRRSSKLAEAISDSMGSDLLPPKRPSTSASRSSAALMSGAAFKQEIPEVPALSSPTSTRDQYGFLKASLHVPLGQYEAWHTSYSQIQDRRTKKWLSYMHECNLPTTYPMQFPSRSAKVRRYIRKGIPPSWRGAAWFFYSGGEAFLQEHPNLYQSLVARSSSELSGEDQEIIERDLNRTFPDNLHFKSESPNAAEQPLLASLRNVLRAFALHCPRIGYCQSLNFIAGLLLLFLPEEKTFCMLQLITTVYLPGTHAISLEGANVDLWVLMMALKESIPGIWGIISSDGEETGSGPSIKLPPISLCTTSWFMSLFIGTLPIESVLRVWDVLFYEGSRTLFRVAVAIFRLGEQRIKRVKEPMEMFQVVQGLPREMLDAGSLLDVALRRGAVSQEWVDKRRWERKKWFAMERAKLAGSVVAFVDDDGDVLGMPKPRRAESMWRRRRK